MSEHNNSKEDDWMNAGSEYSPKSEFSKPRVVEEAVTRCVTLRAKEMKKGYYNTTFNKEGLPLKQWIEDSRKAYCSAVQSLKALMMPEILIEQKGGLDNDKKKKTKVFSKVKKINELFKEYVYYILEQKLVDEKIVYVKTNKYYMPDIDSIVQVRKIFPNGSENLIPINGYWNSQVNAYWDNMVVINDELFEQLIMVIHRLNYFEGDREY